MSVLETFRAAGWSEFEDVRVQRGPRSGVTMAIAVHRTVAGRALGGCRVWSYRSPDDVVAEAQRLARSMSFKAAAAGLHLGGAKAVISVPAGLPPHGPWRVDALRDFAEFVDSFDGRYITAQDVGTSLADLQYVARFTQHVAGRPLTEGGCGDPSPYTAHGVEVGIRASLGGPMAGRHVVVVGLGHVGGELACRLHRLGARLTVADVDPGKRTLARALGARWAAPEEALRCQADVLAPCALGGVLSEPVAEQLRVGVVAGAANTQLADDAVADVLAGLGIVWAPDFVINAGGLIAVADELHGFDPARAERAIEGISDTLLEVYARAGLGETNTLIAAQQLAEERIGGFDGDHI
jgi:leucine dehydrogenase